MNELSILNKSVIKTYEWLKDISIYAGWDNNAKSLAALRVTLHQLRDNIPLESAVYLSAQLPIFIRGIFFENWHPSCAPLKERKADIFLHSVEEHLKEFKESTQDVDSLIAVKAVFKTLSDKISEGEIEKILNILPKQIRSIWEEVEQALSQDVNGKAKDEDVISPKTLRE
jgi:uncharacterized protein (DUF2267 family)